LEKNLIYLLILLVVCPCIMQVMPAEDLVDMPVFVTEDMSSAEVFAEP
jgi:hypothetical protein